MVVSNKETPLVLKVKMGGETIGRHLLENLLFEFLKVDSSSFVQLLRMMYRQVENGGKYRRRGCTGSIHVSFTDRTDIVCFILNLSVHHSDKLDEGRRIYFERLKQEILDKVSAKGFPTHLDLQDQGRFFVGYYHQRQDFFTSKKEQQTTI